MECTCYRNVECNCLLFHAYQATKEAVELPTTIHRPESFPAASLLCLQYGYLSGHVSETYPHRIRGLKLTMHIFSWGLFSPWDYLPDMSLSHKFSQELAVYTIIVLKQVRVRSNRIIPSGLTALLSAASIFGRIIPAYLADRFGRFNSVMVVSFTTSILLLAFWLPLELLPSSSHIEIFSFSACYGFASGAFISLIMPCAAELGPVETTGQRFGTYQVVIGISYVQTDSDIPVSN